MVKTVIINSQKQNREKLVSLLTADGEIEVLASGKDGYDAIKLITRLKPDVVILENHLEPTNGEDISPVLKLHSPSTAVVILVARISDYQLVKAASNEVSGLVHTETDMNMFPRIVKFISRGGSFISPALAARVLRLLSRINPENGNTHGFAADKTQNKTSAKLSIKVLSGGSPTRILSRSELRILACIGEGLTSSQIADKLNMVEGTVRNYVSSVMQKTGLHNRAQMTRYAFSCGIVSLGPE